MAGMFGGRKSDAPLSSFSGGADVVDTMIGKDAVIKGTIEAKGMVRVDGHFEGDIRTDGNIVVAEGAYVLAAVRGRNLIVAGELYGNADVTGKLEITSTGKLLGDIKLDTFVIGDGGIFKGNCTMLSVAEEKVPDLESSVLSEPKPVQISETVVMVEPEPSEPAEPEHVESEAPAQEPEEKTDQSQEIKFDFFGGGQSF